jgi:hypothetical protein
MTSSNMTYRLPAKDLVLFLALAILGGAAFVAGLFQTPERAWINLLLVSYYLVGLGLAGLVLVALHYVTGAHWSLPLRRVPEAMAAVLPWAALGLMAVFIFHPSLYPWSVSDPSAGSESALHHAWLSRPFFLARALVYLALWMVFGVAIVRNSRLQDRSNDPAPTHKNIRLSAGFLVVFGITCWLASTDWVMSLEPRWSSTIFGVYNFAGLFVSGLAAVILVLLRLVRRSGLQAIITRDHWHDLGTLLFSFSCFWMYTWFCQYLLIWYVNNPEETAYYRQRWQGDWPVLGFLDVALNWAIPFVVLLFRFAKRSPRILGAVALVILAGRWVDLSLMIGPSQAAAVPVPGLVEVGLLIGSAGIFAVAVFQSLGKAALVASQPAVGSVEGVLQAE